MAIGGRMLLESLSEDRGLFVNAAGQPQPDVLWKPERPAVLLSGAFNPVHAGHWGLAEAGAQATALPMLFELSVSNVDKPPLSASEVERRLAAFRGRAGVWVTRAPRFLHKAQLFPGATFIVGVDTAQRIIDPAYYADEAALLDALQSVKAQGCRFLVAGRKNKAGRFVQASDLVFPPACADLFTALSADVFRCDLSSTELRRQ